MNKNSKRYLNFFIRTFQNFYNFFSWKLFNSTEKLKAKHIDYILDENLNYRKDFVDFSDEKFVLNDKMTKLISFYLPQFYENETNNKYFGKGFMEWYNTSKCIPQFTGHYQPQIPYDVGFYNLTHDDIMYRQIELAKSYGIYGFCFYYYWFSGDRLLEKPLDNFLKNKELDMPFCLFWANETWRNLWGNTTSNQIIKQQELLDGDEVKFAEDILKYFKDERYIKIDNAPLLIIYQVGLFETKKFKLFLDYLRQYVKKEGFRDICILVTDTRIGEFDINTLDLDGVVEFGHNNMRDTSIDSLLDMRNRFVNPNFKGRVIDVKKGLKKGNHLKENKYKTYRCVCAGWDNSSRKAYTGAEIFYMTPEDYKLWLEDSILWTKNNCSANSQFVFVDSWNEWAEGAHLEPDQKYGYAYLDATREILKKTNF